MPFLSKRAREVAPKFAVADLGGGEAEVVLYGDVMEDEPRDFWTGEPTGEQAVTSERFNRELDAIRGAKHVTVRLNSCGGDVYTGLAIYSALKSLDADVTVRIEGIAASAASAIACAGDEVIVHPGSIFMVHEAAVGLMGYYQLSDFEALAKDLDATNRSLRGIYAERTGRDEDELARMMADETWMVGREIVDAGFATSMETDDEQEQVEEEEGGAVVAGIRHDFTAFRNVPKDLAARVAASERVAHAAMGGAASHMVTTPTGGVVNEEPPQAAEEKGVIPMTLDELRAQCPELVADIESAAAQAERDRIAAIDSIAGGIPADMVAAAKYTEPCTAQELAFRAMSAGKVGDASAEGAFMASLMQDGAESGADAVNAAPAPADVTDEYAETKAEVDEALRIFAQIRKGGAR